MKDCLWIEDIDLIKRKLTDIQKRLKKHYRMSSKSVNRKVKKIKKSKIIVLSDDEDLKVKKEIAIKKEIRRTKKNKKRRKIIRLPN